MEKTNTRGTAGATGLVVALEPVSKMAGDITDDGALASNLAACPDRVKLRKTRTEHMFSALPPISDMLRAG